jgi:hypothetical protein
VQKKVVAQEAVKPAQAREQIHHLQQEAEGSGQPVVLVSFDRSQLGYQLGHCREAPGGPPDLWSAWEYGLRLGLYCSLCYAGFMLVLLVNGVMDLGLMALVATAITAERLAPWPGRLARLTGLAMLGIGVLAIARLVWMA